MKRQPDKKGKKKVIQVWSYPQAKKAFPYLMEVTRSLRDNYLEMRSAKHRGSRIENSGQHRSRHDFIILQEANDAESRATDRYEQDVEELGALGIFVVSPLEGLIAVPFVEEGQLAWFLVDLHADTPMKYWRFQSDPLEERRPITPKQKGAAWVSG
ncbi:MAG: DUF2203 family protein [Gemmataceae bacterium]|nr:DUF2203 family protein [Gemmataceae bacterium]